jgi:hypothetical protein
LDAQLLKPLFFARFHAETVLTLAGCSRIIRPAGSLLVAALFATVCLLGSHGTVGAETQQYQQNYSKGPHHDVLSLPEWRF